MAAWCAEQHVTLHQLKYWLRKLSPRSRKSNASSWIPVTPLSSVESSSSSGLVVRVGEVCIDVRPGTGTILLTVPQPEQIYLAAGYTDLRKSIDGLAALVQEGFALSPFSSALFVFCNRGRDKLKMLYWEHNGFWLLSLILDKSHYPEVWAPGTENPDRVPDNFGIIISSLQPT